MTSLEAARVAGPVAVQDGGRRRHMFEGVPPGGALVPELLARANGAAGNARDAAGLEVFGSLSLVARGGGARVATCDGEVCDIVEGERVDIAAPREARVRYVAVRGAFDVPLCLGGRGTLVAANLGGFEGRWLRAGDRLRVGDMAALGDAAFAAPPMDLEREIRVLAASGPDVARFDEGARAALLSTTFLIAAASDRTGVRLDEARLSRRDTDAGRSTPMTCGAIQIPSGGAPIVLGPDHPTTGGYPVIATVIAADQGSFFARRPGARVRFREVTLEEARAASLVNRGRQNAS